MTKLKTKPVLKLHSKKLPERSHRRLLGKNTLTQNATEKNNIVNSNSFRTQLIIKNKKIASTCYSNLLEDYYNYLGNILKNSNEEINCNLNTTNSPLKFH